MVCGHPPAALALLHKAGTRVANRALSASWGSWYDLVVEKRALAEPMRKGLSRMLNRSLGHAFGSWIEHWEARQLLRSGFKHLMHRDLSRGFLALKSYKTRLLASVHLRRMSRSYLLNFKLTHSTSRTGLRWWQTNRTRVKALQRCASRPVLSSA